MCSNFFFRGSPSLRPPRPAPRAGLRWAPLPPLGHGGCRPPAVSVFVCDGRHRFSCSQLSPVRKLSYNRVRGKIMICGSISGMNYVYRSGANARGRAEMRASFGQGAEARGGTTQIVASRGVAASPTVSKTAAPTYVQVFQIGARYIPPGRYRPGTLRSENIHIHRPRLLSEGYLRSKTFFIHYGLHNEKFATQGGELMQAFLRRRQGIERSPWAIGF
jgi:hypothetical protein